MSEATVSLPASRPRTVAHRLLGDDALARLAARGNQRAFGAIFERHHQGVYRYCLSILRAPEDASDALQNTMVKALQSLEGEQREIALKPWLYRIAHNESVSLVRGRRPQEEISEQTAPVAGDAHEQAAARARLAELVADLQELPERQRGALVMRELSGLGYSEIAAAFGVSVEAAKQAVYEARTTLHEFGEGRDVRCEEIERAISDGDGRAMRGRQVRAHLRQCRACRDFEALLSTRKADLAALAPPIPPAAAAGLLQSILGGIGGSGGGGLLAGGGAVSAAQAVTVAAVAVGAGAVGAASGVIGSHEHERAKHKDKLTAPRTPAPGPSKAEPIARKGIERRGKARKANQQRGERRGEPRAKHKGGSPEPSIAGDSAKGHDGSGGANRGPSAQKGRARAKEQPPGSDRVRGNGGRPERPKPRGPPKGRARAKEQSPGSDRVRGNGGRPERPRPPGLPRGRAKGLPAPP